MTLPDVLFARSFGEAPIPHVDRIITSNTVMYGSLSMHPSTYRKRAALGINVCGKKTMPNTRSPTSQFACSLYQGVGLPGMLMLYSKSVIRVGKYSQPGSLFVCTTFLDCIGEIWPTGISVPNSVATIYFKKVLNKRVRNLVCAVPCTKFRGQRLIINCAGSKHTPTLHLGYCEKTKIQSESKCIIPGTRTASQLRACVEEIVKQVESSFE
jgi:hypothetical protein